MRPLALYAYPSGPRRDEVLDTLLMAAAAGRRRPGARESANLLRHGLRARLGRPHSRTVGFFAAFVALVAGFFAAALTNRLAWEAAPDLPAAPERAALAQLIAPGLPVVWEDWNPDHPSDRRAPFATTGGGELTSRRIHSFVAGTPETGQVAAYLAGLRKRLADAGWRVVRQFPTGGQDLETGEYQNDSAALIARNDRLVLEFWDSHDVTYQQNDLSLTIYRTEPPWISAVTFAAGLPGAIAGWLIFAWASRRTEGRATASTLANRVAASGLALVTPALLLGADYPTVLWGDHLSSSPFWVGLEPTNEFGLLAVPTGAMFAAALLIAVCCRPARRRAATLADRDVTGVTG